VTRSPFNRSTMKKRFSFCVKVGLGIGTIVILGFRFAIFDFRFPASSFGSFHNNIAT